MSKTLLTARDLHKSYRMGRFKLDVLRGVSLELYEGEMLAVMGSSGCGKSTLLHLLGALDLPDRGTVQMNGDEIFKVSARKRDRRRNRDVGFVFQFYHLLPEFNVLENALMPRMIRESVFSWWRQRDTAKSEVLEVLERVGLKNRVKHKPNELSGGERQRVAIARALANHPRLLLADEPTGNLDATMGKEIMQILRDLNQAGQTIVLVTHDPAIADMADRRVRLVEGRIKS